MITPTHPYWPMTPDSWIDYSVFRIKGVLLPDKLQVPVTFRELYPINNHQRLSFVKLPDKQPRIVMQYQIHPNVVKPTPENINMDAVLIEGLWSPIGGTFKYIGEMAYQYPPQALLALDTTVGPIINGSSYIPQFDQNTGECYPINFNWQYRTTYKGSWGPWPDVVWTGHLEIPNGANRSIYNYVFAKDIGLVDFWYGVVDANNVINDGIEYYATGFGNW